jgi:UDP-GlcNAc:undecaprenyl-phosphate/decaprenyl-phosphate GlcNAc-1-phosphate transferase
MRTVLIAFALAFVASLLFTWAVREMARRYGFYDQQGGRKIHRGEIPRLGGIAVTFAFAVPLVALYLWGNKISTEIFRDQPMVLALVLGGAIVAATGIIDDTIGLRARWKLVGQIGAALVAYFVGVQILHISIPLVGLIELGPLSLPVTILWFVVVTNAVNLVDGLDGLAGSVVVLAGGTLFGMSLIEGDYLAAVVLASLVGSTLGFLRFNVRPASIFLGDTGSLVLGYLLALVSVHSAQKTYALFSITAAFVALGVPIFDLGMAFVRRLLVGRSPFVADQYHVHHMHHILLRKGLSQNQSVLFLGGTSALLGLVALVIVNGDDRLSAIVLVAVGFLMVFAVRGLGYVELIRSGHRQNVLGASEAHATEQLAGVLALRDRMRGAASVEEVFALIERTCAEQDLGFEEVHVLLTERPKLELRWASTALANNQDVHFQALERETFPIRVSHRVYGEVRVAWYRERAVLRAHQCALGQLLADGLLEHAVGGRSDDAEHAASSIAV